MDAPPHLDEALGRLRAKALRIARSVCHDKSLAQDVAQEVLTDLLRTYGSTLATLAESDLLGLVTVTIVKRRCIKVDRKVIRGDVPTSELAHPAPPPLDIVSALEVVHVMRRAVREGKLSPEDAAIIQMASVDGSGWSGAKIGQELGIREGSARSRLKRARDRAWKVLSEQFELDEASHDSHSSHHEPGGGRSNGADREHTEQEVSESNDTPSDDSNDKESDQ